MQDKPEKKKQRMTHKSTEKESNMQEQKTQKIAIYGGSFDPIHFGHVDIVNNLKKKFDSVIVVPAHYSPFKDRDLTDSKLRLKLCKKIFGGEKVKVSDCELKREGVSYSVDTAKKFAKKNVKLFWVIGSEEVSRLSDWHDFSTLAKLVTFAVVNRPNYYLDRQDVKRIQKQIGAKITLLPFTGTDISSTRIRLDEAFGYDVSLPSATRGICGNGYAKYVLELYNHGLNDRRIQHCYRTAVVGEKLAKRYGVNSNDAVVACILHDIAKEENRNDYANLDGIDGYDEVCVHGLIGAQIVRELGVKEEICKAIEHHTVGEVGMSLLSEIVYVADKTEGARTFAKSGYFRYLSLVDLQAAAYEILKDVKASTLKKGEHYDERGDKVIAYYEQICANRDYPTFEKWCESARASETEKLTQLIARGKSIKAESVKTAKIKENVKQTAVVQEIEIDTRDYNVKEPKDLCDLIAKGLSDKKAQNIDIVDLSGKTTLADYFVIATGSSTTHVRALYEDLDELLSKKFALEPLRRDVDKDWIAVDYGSVIVHIFRKETREFYNIERLWSDGKNISRLKD